jgi:O-antigen/teichoic acid export membrane protein
LSGTPVDRPPDEGRRTQRTGLVVIGRATVDRLLSAGRADQPRQIVRNSVSMVGSVALTSGLGFVYWFVAALYFQPAEIGVASASISAMLLFGSLATLGLGTLLIGEMARHRGREPGLIAAAMIVAGTIGTVLGVAFALTAAAVSREFQPLGESPIVIGLFSAGVGLTAAVSVLDFALLGLLRSDLQFARIAVWALAKLGLLVAASLALVGFQPRVTIIGTWVVGLVLSIAALAAYSFWKGSLGRILPLQFETLRMLPRAALRNYILNLSLSVGQWTMPILVTTILSAATGGPFFIAWTIAGVALFVPAALAQALFAVCARAPETLRPNLLLTLRLSFAAGAVVWLATLALGPVALGLLGRQYTVAAPALVILALGIFPLSVKVHYVTIGRLEDTMIATAWVSGAGALVELLLAAAGGLLAGLTGVALGVLLGLMIQAVAMAPRIRRVLRTGGPSAGSHALPGTNERSAS